MESVKIEPSETTKALFVKNEFMNRVSVWLVFPLLRTVIIDFVWHFNAKFCFSTFIYQYGYNVDFILVVVS